MSDPSAATQTSRTLRRRFVWSLVLALVIYLALAVYGDLARLREALSSFPWVSLPLILGLTLVNYVGRLIKWHWYLGLVGAKLGWRDSARIFGVGMSMVMTPGKVGELLKSYMVKQVAGTPMSITAPIVLAERLTDGLAMLVLAGVGLTAFPDPRLRLAALAALAALLTVVLLVQVRPLARAVLALGERTPGMHRFAHNLATFYESSYTLLAPRNLCIAVSIGTVSWLGEGLAYYVVLTGLGAQPGLQTALKAVFIFSISTIVGALVATPGGLGGTEGSLVALCEQLLGLARAPATASTLIVRLATLWFGVAIGLASMARWPELLAGVGDQEMTGDQEVSE